MTEAKDHSFRRRVQGWLGEVALSVHFKRSGDDVGAPVQPGLWQRARTLISVLVPAGTRSFGESPVG
jgi:hypothetical protein